MFLSYYKLSVFSEIHFSVFPPCCSPFKRLGVLKRLLSCGHMFMVMNDGWLARGPGVTGCLQVDTNSV